jgi:hypothetical protein
MFLLVKSNNSKIYKDKTQENIKKMKAKLFIALGIVFLLSLSLASAVIVDSVSQDKLFPGESASISVKVKNTLTDDVDDVSVVLNLDNTQFTSIGGAEDSEEEIDEDDEEGFSFELKAPANLAPGDYNIPYTITYTFKDNESVKTGSFGITVGAETELSYGIETEKNIVGEKGSVSVKIVNSGLGDIGFMNVRVLSATGFEILSTQEDYIGTVRSDDFETATFDVAFKKTNAVLTVQIKYKDFDNNEATKTVTLPFTVYSRERALELGLIQKSNTWIYGVVIGLVILWFIWRKWRKARKKKQKLNAEA